MTLDQTGSPDLKLWTIIAETQRILTDFSRIFEPMYRYISKIVLIILFQTFTSFLMAHVALDYPAGGELFLGGHMVTIEWHIVAPHNTLNWDLYFSPDGGESWEVIDLDLPPNTLSYTWIVPFSITTQGQVKVFMDNDKTDYQDTSMNFTIGPIPVPPMMDTEAHDATIECDGNLEAAIQAWLDNQGDATITNNCGSYIWTNDYQGVNDECGLTGSAIVTFTVTDACGSTYTSAYLEIVDNTHPEINVPANNIVVECDGNGNIAELNAWFNSHGGAQASDACSNVTWINTASPVSNGCGATGSTSIIFTVRDQCGNSTTTAASFRIEDNVAPAMDILASDLILECGSANQQSLIQSWLQNNGGAHASDICGSVHWFDNYTILTDGCGSGGITPVIFFAGDECGNNSFTTASIKIMDTVAPAINVIARDTTMACGNPNQQAIIQQWLENHGGAHAQDVCGNITWTNNFLTLTDLCGTSGSASVNFTATDECGHNSVTTATIIIEDKTAPVVDIPSRDTTIVCGESNTQISIQHWLDTHGGAHASDLCGNVSWTNDFSAAFTCDTTASHIVTFSVIDECGNSSITNASLQLTVTVTSINTGTPGFDFRIFPNPVRDILHVVFDKKINTPLQLTLFDACGKPLWNDQDDSKEITIPVDRYVAGLYFLQIKTDHGVFARKVVIE